jgi:hypothetical protein
VQASGLLRAAPELPDYLSAKSAKSAELEEAQAYSSSQALSSFRCSPSPATLARNDSDKLRLQCFCLHVLQVCLALLFASQLFDSCMPPCRSYKHFQDEWSECLEHAHVSAMSTSTVVFERVWTNKQQDRTRPNAISIWRPVPPPGYVSVGDCLVAGSWNAPRSATVLLSDTGSAGLVADAVVRLPARWWLSRQAIPTGSFA